MKIIKSAIAGTLESSDALVSIYPSDDGALTVEINSIVGKQFGAQIEKVTREMLERFRVTAAMVTVDDRGALDYAIKARLETAILRAGEEGADHA